jgi:hypothetical protein
MRLLLRFQVLLAVGIAVCAPQIGAARPALVADGSLPAVRDTLVIVRRGQNLSQVVMRHFLKSDYATAHEMLDWTRYHNRLTSDVLITGQSLRVPLGPLSPDPGPAQLQDSDTTFDGEPVRGIYINVRRSGQAGALRLARQLKRAGGNAIVFDIKDRDGMLVYDSLVDFAVDIGATREAKIDDPRVFIQQLKKLGLHVIARLVCFQDAHLASSRPDLLPLTADGQAWTQHGSSTWVDPALPEVQGYLFGLMQEAAGLGVDELQLDYVRFPTVGDGALPAHSEPSRADVITDFVEQASAVAEAHGMQISADVFGVAAWEHAEDSQRTGQDLQRLLPHLDIVSPMLYPSHFSAGFGAIEDPSQQPFDLVYRGCVRARGAAAHHGVRLRPWIQAFAWRVTDYSAFYVAEQLRAATEGGASGWLLWNPGNQYEAAMEAMRYFLPRTAPAADVPDLELKEVEAKPDGLGAIGEPLGAVYLVRTISPLL